jgi:hypothetical protein
MPGFSSKQLLPRHLSKIRKRKTRFLLPPMVSVVDSDDDLCGLLIQSMLDINASRKDPYHCWFAANMLTHTIKGNVQAKQTVLKVAMESNPDGTSLVESIMYKLARGNQENINVRVSVGLLIFLAEWMYDCPAVVNNFLEEDSNVQFVKYINAAYRTD